MVQQPLKVRRAEQDDIAYIVDLSRRVQEKLTALGSLQQIGPIPRETVEAQVNAGTAHILDGSSRRLGSVFVEPVTIESLGCWKLDDATLKPWLLHKLMLEPGEQGRGLGARFLGGKRQAAGFLYAGRLQAAWRVSCKWLRGGGVCIWIVLLFIQARNVFPLWSWCFFRWLR